MGLYYIIFLLGARRKQALTSITVEDVIVDHDKYFLLPNKTSKHSAPNRPLKPFVYHSYKENAKLSIVNCMQYKYQRYCNEVAGQIIVLFKNFMAKI